MKKTASIIMLLGLVLCLLASCASVREGAENIPEINKETLLEPGCVIGVAVGTGDEAAVAEEFPKAEIKYFDDNLSAYSAVASGKIDALVYGKLQMELAVKNGQKGVRLLDDTVGESYRVAVGISPSAAVPELETKLNAFIAELRADGTLEDMYNRWCVLSDETMPDIAPPENPALILRVGTSGTTPPYNYYAGTELCGYDIELARRFGAWLGADIEFSAFDFSGLVSAAQGGAIDCIMSELFVTPERAEAIGFSEPLFLVERGIMVRDAISSPDAVDTEMSDGFFASVAESFRKTFIREERWRLFVSGIGTTLLITALAIIFGTALGFGLFLLCRRGNRAANLITRMFVRLVQGMPMVVLLMILYYIVFGSAAISGVAVSVLGFALVFGASTYGMLKSAVGAVEAGQTEAAWALGYTDRRAIFRVVLPQAMPHFMPAYKGEITATIKATAIVGYVAVQDLTKMGDIVRSRTYEAFFPLIAVAVVYFALAAVLTLCVNRLELCIDPRRRRREDILKGVKTDD